VAANITGEMRMLVTPTALTGCHNQELHNLRVLWSFFSRISDNKPITLRHRVSYYTRNYFIFFNLINPLTPNDPYSGRTEPLISKRCILYIYSTNIGTEYFKHGIYSSFFLFKIQFVLIILTYLVPVLFTFYIQGVLILQK